MIKQTTIKLYRSDFFSFVQRAFRVLNDDERLGDEPYIGLLCHHAEQVAAGAVTRLVVNMPPRHLKTLTFSVALPAWVLGNNPCEKILIVTHSEPLAEEIAGNIRRLLRSDWYQRIFPTRLAKDRTKLLDFKTAQGGGVYAASFGAKITGRGATLTIVDDPVDIGDANDLGKLIHVNQLFDTVVSSRSNNRRTGRIVTVMQRLHERDLSAHMLRLPSCKHVVLPMIAPRREEYDLGGRIWVRRKGDVLRPDAYTSEQIALLREEPFFHSQFQQDPAAEQALRFRAEDFPKFHIDSMPDRPEVALSIDPGHGTRPGNSFSVIQVWMPVNDNHYLIHQWRDRVDYVMLKNAYSRIVRVYKPAIVFIENTGFGAALIADCSPLTKGHVVSVTIPRKGKGARLNKHREVIRSQQIHLPMRAPWLDEFVREFVDFPLNSFSDQIDALTQYLDHIRYWTPLQRPDTGGIAALTTGSGTRSCAAVQQDRSRGITALTTATGARPPQLGPNSSQVRQTTGAVLMRGWRRF